MRRQREWRTILGTRKINIVAHVKSQGVSGQVRHRIGACPVVYKGLTYAKDFS